MDECPVCGSWVPGVAGSGPPWFEGTLFRCRSGHDLIVAVDESVETEHGGLAVLVAIDA